MCGSVVDSISDAVDDAFDVVNDVVDAGLELIGLPTSFLITANNCKS